MIAKYLFSSDVQKLLQYVLLKNNWCNFSWNRVFPLNLLIHVFLSWRFYLIDLSIIFCFIIYDLFLGLGDSIMYIFSLLCLSCFCIIFAVITCFLNFCSILLTPIIPIFFISCGVYTPLFTAFNFIFIPVIIFFIQIFSELCQHLCIFCDFCQFFSSFILTFWYVLKGDFFPIVSFFFNALQMVSQILICFESNRFTSMLINFSLSFSRSSSFLSLFLFS